MVGRLTSRVKVSRPRDLPWAARRGVQPGGLGHLKFPDGLAQRSPPPPLWSRAGVWHGGVGGGGWGVGGWSASAESLTRPTSGPGQAVGRELFAGR
jgi:hypothetical protein